MSRVYGVALIGCGHMGEAHIQDIYYKENVRMEYVCDLNQEQAKNFQRRYGAAHICTDYRECAASPAVDIVIIATYAGSHLTILKECLNAGKHVICEKPIAATLKEGDEFLKEVKAHPECKVLVGHILRHNETYQKVAEMIQEDAIGKPIVFRMVQNHHIMDWKKYYSILKESSPLLDCGVHYVDVMRWFTKASVTGVNATGARTEEGVPEQTFNYGIMTLELSDGSVGYYEAGWSNTISSENKKEFIGPKGSIRIIFRKDRQTHQAEGDLIEYYKYPDRTYEMINLPCKRKPTGAQLDYLIKMIETGCPEKPTIEEVYDSFRICLEAQEQVFRKLQKQLTNPA